MKNKAYVLFGSLLFVFAIVFVLRFVVGGDEDMWICENNTWVKHGQPIASPPETGCGPEKLIGGDKDNHDCLIGAGFSWCEKKGKCLREWEEPCTQEEAFIILSKLKSELDFSFSGIGNTTFKWFFLSEESKGDGSTLEKEIPGKVITVENVGSTEVKDIKNYFEKENFLVDQYNLTDGTDISKEGFKKENVICLITKTLVNFDPLDATKVPDPISNINIKIECNDLSEN